MERLNWDEWLSANLSGNRQMGLDSSWPARFAIRMWWIWRWRNDAAFNDRRTAADQKCLWIVKKEVEINDAFTKQRVAGASAGRHTEGLVQWEPPPANWIKINVDGSCCRTTGAAACGGLLRDHRGRWLGGFLYNIGRCTAEEAETWAVLQGLRAANRFGYQNILIESDSKRTVRSLQDASKRHGPCRNIITACFGLVRQFTNVHFGHVFREQNRVADILAKQALSQPIGLTTLAEAPGGLQDWIWEDQLGARLNRQSPLGVA